MSRQCNGAAAYSVEYAFLPSFFSSWIFLSFFLSLFDRVPEKAKKKGGAYGEMRAHRKLHRSGFVRFLKGSLSRKGSYDSSTG